MAIDNGLVSGIQSDLDFDPDSLDPGEAVSRITEFIRNGRIQLARQAAGGSLEIERQPASRSQTGEDATGEGRERRSDGATDSRADREVSGYSRDDVERDLERILARLRPEVVPDEELTAAVKAARSETEPGKRKMAVDLVRRRVGEANDAARLTQARRESVAELLTDLAECSSPQVAVLEERLELALTDPSIDLAKVRADVERLREEANPERDYVEESLREVLLGLGYEVGSEFTTVLAEDGFTDVERGDGQSHWPEGYAVRVRRTSQGLLSFNVIRAPSERADQAALDLEVEESWCSSVEELEARLAERGVEVTRRTATEPGAQPVQVVEDRHAHGSGPSSRRVERQRSMEGRNGG